MTISTYIKKRLKEIGMTQTELAEALGNTRQNFNNKMSRDNFTVKELTEIAKILNTSIIIKDESGTETVIVYE